MNNEAAHEPHYTVSDVGSMWSLSPDAIRRLFADEPGVIRIGAVRRSRFKRPYVTLRIPASVLERVHRRMAVI
jgi:hypothetical protein